MRDILNLAPVRLLMALIHSFACSTVDSFVRLSIDRSITGARPLASGVLVWIRVSRACSSLASNAAAWHLPRSLLSQLSRPVVGVYVPERWRDTRNRRSRHVTRIHPSQRRLDHHVRQPRRCTLGAGAAAPLGMYAAAIDSTAPDVNSVTR